MKNWNHLTPCWSVCTWILKNQVAKIKLQKSSSTNWIFTLKKSISKWIFAGYTGSKNQVWNRLKIQFVKLDFSKLILTEIKYRSTGGKGRFIYILDRSNSSSITFWTCQFGSRSRSNWTSIWTGNSNGSWTDKQSSHFSTVKEIRVKATFFFM
jgi:hypothetical protein